MDLFQETTGPQAERLDALLSSELLAVGDLTLTEVLQGFGSEKDFNQALGISFPFHHCCPLDEAVDCGTAWPRVA